MTKIEQTPQAPQMPELQLESQSETPQEDMSDSPFAKMFRGGATKEQVRQFINLFLKNMVLQFKKSDEIWKRAQKRMRDVIDGKKLDC
jgi:hypothetical protein